MPQHYYMKKLELKFFNMKVKTSCYYSSQSCRIRSKHALAVVSNLRSVLVMHGIFKFATILKNLNISRIIPFWVENIESHEFTVEWT